MRIFVTGATGFVGGYIADYFKSQREHQVFKHSRGLNIDFCYKSSDADVVIHCAAAAGPWHSTENIIRDNILFTQELIQLAKEFPPKLFVFISSVSIYGDMRDHVWVDETYKPIDPSTYGLSKLLGERMLTESELTAISFRCPGIVGPKCTGKNWPVRLAREILEEKKVCLFNAKSRFNSVIHVEDICKAVEVFSNNSEFKEHRIVNLCATHPVQIRVAAQALANGLGRELKYKSVDSKIRSHLFDSEIASDISMSVTDTMFRFGQEFRNV